MDGLHARVPADDCAVVVAAHAAGGAVGHDVQANAAGHEIEEAESGDDTSSLVIESETRMKARELELEAFGRVVSCFNGYHKFINIL